MKTKPQKDNAGFSLVEILITMGIMLILLGIVGTLLAQSLRVRARESQRSDALASAQAALNVLSREIANAGFGIVTSDGLGTSSNGIVAADSNANRIHFRTNVDNVGPVGGPTVVATNDNGEDVTYFFDTATSSIVRYDPNDTPTTSVVVNKISNVTFQYFDYAGVNSSGVEVTTPTNSTGRVRITVTVQMDQVYGQPNPSSIVFTSDVTLRNASYMLNQY